MKQLPHVAAALYGMPWSILPQSHAELGSLYQAYIRGNLPAVSLEGSGRRSSGVSYAVQDGIACIMLEGVIAKRAPDMVCGPSIVDLAKVDALLEQVGAESAIDTLVLDLNSPGGMVVGLEETASRIRELADGGKKVVAYTDFQCCSAAYYLAAAADEIYAAPSAIIGSIGTYCAGLDDSRAWEMEGMELILAKSGDLKAMGHPGKAWTAEERGWLQGKADSAGAEFRDWVLSRRPDVPEAVMQGQWFHAREAPELVDGYRRDLPELLAELMFSRG